MILFSSIKNSAIGNGAEPVALRRKKKSREHIRTQLEEEIVEECAAPRAPVPLARAIMLDSANNQYQ